ncbi:hypothetical protein D6833_09135, partial [Candidatus Parcubacteria bacterium]
MKLTRRSLVAVIVLLSMVLTVTTITTAQAPGPKGGPFVPATPTADVRPPSQDSNFRRAAEEALREYLETRGPGVPLARISLDAEGRRLRVEEQGPLLPLPLADARRAAQEKVQEIARSGTTDWDGATLEDAIPLYDLSGEITAYLFPVRKGDEPAGYLTVSALALPNPVLEF